MKVESILVVFAPLRMLLTPREKRKLGTIFGSHGVTSIVLGVWNTKANSFLSVEDFRHGVEHNTVARRVCLW